MGNYEVKLEKNKQFLKNAKKYKKYYPEKLGDGEIVIDHEVLEEV